MPITSIQFLHRVAAELYYRSSCIKYHLEEIRSSGSSQYDQLIETIETALTSIEAAVLAATSDVSQLPPEEQPRTLLVPLHQLSRWFVQIHEMLCYLPALDIYPEAFDALSNAYGSRFTSLKPSLIPGALFNAFHFDLNQNLRNLLPDFDKIQPASHRNTVLQLPVCDRASPSGWTILAHEMGHAVDRSENISAPVAAAVAPGNDIIGRWAKEFCADLIAAEVFGPATAMSLLSLEYCLYPQTFVHVPQESHPLTLWRFRIIRDQMLAKHGHDYLTISGSWYRAAWEYSVERAIPDPAKRPDRNKSLDLAFEHLIQPLATQLSLKIAAAMGGNVVDRQSVSRCLSRLKAGLPIGAQGAPRNELKAKISNFHTMNFDSDAEKTREFKSLTSGFNENPLPTETVLLALAQRRENIICESIEGQKFPTTAVELTRFCDELRAIDSLVLRSISSSMIHHRLCKL